MTDYLTGATQKVQSGQLKLFWGEVKTTVRSGFKYRLGLMPLGA